MFNPIGNNNNDNNNWHICKLFWHEPSPSLERKLFDHADSVYEAVQQQFCLLHENHSQMITVCHEKGFSGVGMILCCALFEKQVQKAMAGASFPIEWHHLLEAKQPALVNR